MVVGPCIEVKAIEGNALRADRDGDQTDTDIAVEAVLVHAEIRRRVAKPDEAGNGNARRHGTYTGIRAASCCMERRLPACGRSGERIRGWHE